MALGQMHGNYYDQSRTKTHQSEAAAYSKNNPEIYSIEVLV